MSISFIGLTPVLQSLGARPDAAWLLCLTQDLDPQQVSFSNGLSVQQFTIHQLITPTKDNKVNVQRHVARTLKLCAWYFQLDPKPWHGMEGCTIFSLLHTHIHTHAFTFELTSIDTLTQSVPASLSPLTLRPIHKVEAPVVSIACCFVHKMAGWETFDTREKVESEISTKEINCVRWNPELCWRERAWSRNVL